MKSTQSLDKAKSLYGSEINVFIVKPNIVQRKAATRYSTNAVTVVISWFVSAAFFGPNRTPKLLFGRPPESELNLELNPQKRTSACQRIKQRAKHTDLTNQ